MTQIKVDTVTNAAGTGNPDFADGLTYEGSATSTLNLCEYTSSASQPSSPKNGALWYDTGNSVTKIYANGVWNELTAASSGSGGIAWGGDRALAYTLPYGSRTIEYFDITTSGNATSFGSFSSVAHARAGTVSDGTSGVIAGGSSYINNISYNTIATTGDISDFGDLTVGRRGIASASDGTYGLYAGGQISGNGTNVIDYITIASSGNATDFGDLSELVMENTGVNDATRAVFTLGFSYTSNGILNSMEYVTIASASNSTDFGDLLAVRRQGGSTGASDGTFGVFSSGDDGARSNVIQYITIQTTSNATDFGDLLAAIDWADTTNNATIGVTVSGNASTGDTNVIQYFTIASPSNATDFGDLAAATSQIAATSGNAS